MDNYTKSVLTVIAVALVSISFQLSDTNAIEQAKASDNCGSLLNPCHVTTGHTYGEVVSF